MMDTGERNESNESQELPINVLRGAALIRDEVSVRWPAGHVEIALIQLQRRRQQRRYAVAGATLRAARLAADINRMRMVPELHWVG